MHSFAKLALTLGTVALIAAPAAAQGFRGGPRGGSLIGNKSVQQELKLSADQVEKGQAVSQAAREKRQDDFQKLGDLTPEERGPKMQELVREMRADVNKGLKDILSADQMKRYQQIELQVRGAEALGDPEVASKLNLTADQKTKLKEIQENAGQQRREIFQQAQGDRQAMGAKMQALQKETNEKATALLTDDQKKTWKELNGEPFEIKYEPRPQ